MIESIEDLRSFISDYNSLILNSNNNINTLKKLKKFAGSKQFGYTIDELIIKELELNAYALGMLAITNSMIINKLEVQEEENKREKDNKLKIVEEKIKYFEDTLKTGESSTTISKDILNLAEIGIIDGSELHLAYKILEINKFSAITYIIECLKYNYKNDQRKRNTRKNNKTN